MTRLGQVTTAAAGTLLLLVSASNISAQQPTTRTSAANVKGSSAQSGGPPAYLKAVVIDDRLSTLRRDPGLQSEVIRRLRLGHPAFIVNSVNPRAGQPKFCRVAITRRTRGWILLAALAVQGRPGEDQRVMKRIETANDGFDRIRLCRILIERFSKSQLVPRALLILGEEAERAAESLSQRARRRLADASIDNSVAGLRDYYLNDTGLDRYSKLRIVFDFNESTTEYAYDGKAYHDLVKRFPDREETTQARQRIELANQKKARSR